MKPVSQVRLTKLETLTTYQCIEDWAYRLLWTVISTMSPSLAVRRGHGVSPLQTIITLQRPPSCMWSAVAYTGVFVTMATCLDSSTVRRHRGCNVGQLGSHHLSQAYQQWKKEVMKGSETPPSSGAGGPLGPQQPSLIPIWAKAMSFSSH